MRNESLKKNTNRVDKVNSLVQQLVGSIILPYLKNTKGLTTISKVQTSKDLRWAKVWITVLDGDDEAVLNTLHNNIYEIQGELNRDLAMKIVPRLSFHLDTSTRYADHISKIFQEIEKEKNRKSE
jgi:ribosome-binding factor A